MNYRSYQYGGTYRPRRKSKRKLLFGIALVLVGVGIIFMTLNKKSNSGDNGSVPKQPTAKTQDKNSEIRSIKGKYLFSGTVVIARAVENEARRADGNIDYNQPFSKFNTFNPGQYDAWEFDHECPMTMQNIPYRQQVANTMFNCRPEFLPAMRRVFPNIVANIANNHTKDLGEDGYEDTVSLLEKGGLQTIGNADPRVKEDICEVVAWPVRLVRKDKSELKGTLPVAFCAWHYFEKDPGPGEIEAMDRYARIMPVFAFMQVGVEYRPNADEKQIDIAHKIVDRGPEFLIGNSPHWVQNTEAYKGKLIVYSTGNFIFDQLDSETNRGLSIAAEMTAPYDDNVAKWLELGDKCRPRDDDCIEQAEKLGLKKISIKLTYEVIGSSGGYRAVTQRAGPALQKAIEERANWQQTLNGLGQN